MKNMKICIFCPNILDVNTTPEHILLSALGGRKTTKRVICSKCNQYFGGTVDLALAKQVKFLRNQLQLESGTGKPPPGLSKMKSGNETVKIKSDGTPEIVGKPYTLTPLGDGKFGIQIAVNSVEQLNSVIPHIAAETGIAESELRKQIELQDATLVTRRPPQVHVHHPFGGKDECRSILKSCITLWTLQVGNEEIKSRTYDLAREYAKTGLLCESKVATPIVQLDSRTVPHVDVFKKRFGKFFNLIYIRSDANGRVVGHFTLYNIISWRLILAESGGKPDMKIGLASNPSKPRDWTDTIADEFDLEMEWLDMPTFDFKSTQQRFAAAIEESQNLGMDKTADLIVKMVSDKYGLGPDDEIIDEAIISEIQTRIAYYLAGVPYEEQISVEKLLGKQA